MSECAGKDCDHSSHKNKETPEEKGETKTVQIKMNRKQRRAYGRARMPWSKQVDSFLCLLNHNKYVKKKEGVEK